MLQIDGVDQPSSKAHVEDVEPSNQREWVDPSCASQAVKGQPFEHMFWSRFLLLAGFDKCMAFSEAFILFGHRALVANSPITQLEV